MGIMTVKIPPYSISESANILVDLDENIKDFPLITIGKDSYIVDARVYFTAKDNLTKQSINIQIGKYCSIADNVRFMIDMNHDINGVILGCPKEYENTPVKGHIHHKCQIIMENDVWIGEGTHIMSGVTIHNGAIVGCGAIVTKDVPPYAIVGGVPAKILGYRFNGNTVKKMQAIAWWEWDEEMMCKSYNSFCADAEHFADEHYPKMAVSNEIKPMEFDKTVPVYLLMPDFYNAYPCYKRIMLEFINKYGDDNKVQLLLWIAESKSNETELELLQKAIDNIYKPSDNIIVRISKGCVEEAFTVADKLITTRSADTVRYSQLAYKYGVEIISGVDEPIF